MSEDDPVWDACAVFSNNAVLAFISTLAECFAEHAENGDGGASIEKLLQDNPTLSHLRRRLWVLARDEDPLGEGPVLHATDRERLQMMVRHLDYEIGMFLRDA